MIQFANELGWFERNRGHRYVLEMNIPQDGSALPVTNPKLRVGIDEAVYEGFMFVDFLIFGWAVLSCFAGALGYRVLAHPEFAFDHSY